VALLELLREGLIEVVQTESLAPLHVRRAGPERTLHLVDEPAANESLAAPADESPFADDTDIEPQA